MNKIEDYINIKVVSWMPEDVALMVGDCVNEDGSFNPEGVALMKNLLPDMEEL